MGFEDHELIFLGTGGGRVLCATQHRQTGGIMYKFNGKQTHIDPGPGAIVYLNRMKIDRLKTEWIIATHNHTDHINDIPIIIESVHETLTKPAGILISTEEYIHTLHSYYRDLLVDIIPMQAGKTVKLTNHTSILGTKIVHGNTQGFGLIFQQIDAKDPSKTYQIGFTSDTEIYDGFGEIYKDIDILIANVLRPSNKTCPRHACVEEFIPALEIAQPKTCIITHYGALFDPPWSDGNIISQQMTHIQESIGKNTKVIGAQDNLRLKIPELLGS
ncbi:MAG: hypothetical protein JW776_11355 [Candidatus Lokiarchaeota archaeon]|nr:hypothetical protein [Candidatus Lokiarchaeota archaeon]